MVSSPGAERDARMAFWASYMRNYSLSHPEDAETVIRRAQDAYVAGSIIVETLEFRIEAALFADRVRYDA